MRGTKNSDAAKLGHTRGSCSCSGGSSSRGDCICKISVRDTGGIDPGCSGSMRASLPLRMMMATRLLGRGRGRISNDAVRQWRVRRWIDMLGRRGSSRRGRWRMRHGALQMMIHRVVVGTDDRTSTLVHGADRVGGRLSMTAINAISVYGLSRQ